MKDILERRLVGLKPEDLGFSSSRGKFSSNKITLRLMKLCQGARIPSGDKLIDETGESVGIVFDCFRHTRTAKWVEIGFSDELIRRATGHKTLQAYRNYVKIRAVVRLVGDDHRTVQSRDKITLIPLLVGK